MSHGAIGRGLGRNLVVAPHRGPRLVVVETVLEPQPSDAVTAPPPNPASPRDDRPRHVHVELAAVARPATAARRAVREHCRGRVADEVIDDVLIIVSELVANVLEHGGGTDGLVLELTVRATELDVQVIGPGTVRSVPPLGEWRLPPAAQTTGRGLAVVRRLSRWVTVDGDDAVRDHSGWVAINVSIPIAPA